MPLPINTTTSKHLIKQCEIFKVELGYLTDEKARKLLTSNKMTEEIWQNILSGSIENNNCYLEILKTLTALYCFSLPAFSNANKKANLVDINAALVTSQNKSNGLSSESFDLIYDITRNNTFDKPMECNLVTCLIVYSRVAQSAGFKSRVLELSNDSIYINTSLNTHDLMHLILNKLDWEHLIQVLPSIENYFTYQNYHILTNLYSMMKISWNDFCSLERCVSTMDLLCNMNLSLSEQDKLRLLSLVYLAQLYSDIGTEKYRKFNGEIVEINNLVSQYHKIHKVFCDVISLQNQSFCGVTSKEHVLNQYLRERAESLHLHNSKNKLLTMNQQFLTRLAGMLHCFTSEAGNLIVEEFNKLSNERKDLVTAHLSFESSSIESWGHVNHLAAVLQNLSRLVATNNLREGIKQGLNGAVCIAMLIYHLETHHKDAVFSGNTHFSFIEIARLAEKYPKLFNPDTFKVEDYEWNPRQKQVQLKASKRHYLEAWWFGRNTWSRTMFVFGTGAVSCYATQRLFANPRIMVSILDTAINAIKPKHSPSS